VGINPENAAADVAKYLKHSGFTQRKTISNPSGEITAKQIVRWQEEKGRKSLSGSDESYKILSEALKQRTSPKTPEQARRRVRRLINELHGLGGV
jgi:hypothetical protein